MINCDVLLCPVIYIFIRVYSDLSFLILSGWLIVMCISLSYYIHFRVFLTIKSQWRRKRDGGLGIRILLLFQKTFQFQKTIKNGSGYCHPPNISIALPHWLSATGPGMSTLLGAIRLSQYIFFVFNINSVLLHQVNDHILSPIVSSQCREY